MTQLMETTKQLSQHFSRERQLHGLYGSRSFYVEFFFLFEWRPTDRFQVCTRDTDRTSRPSPVCWWWSATRSALRRFRTTPVAAPMTVSGLSAHLRLWTYPVVYWLPRIFWRTQMDSFWEKRLGFLCDSGGPTVAADPRPVLAVAVALHAATGERRLRRVDPAAVDRPQAAAAVDSGRRPIGRLRGRLAGRLRRLPPRNDSGAPERPLARPLLLLPGILPRRHETAHLPGRCDHKSLHRSTFSSKKTFLCFIKFTIKQKSSLIELLCQAFKLEVWWL